MGKKDRKERDIAVDFCSDPIDDSHFSEKNNSPVKYIPKFVKSINKMTEREDNVYKAKLAEQAERYDEMVASMKTVASLDVELTVEERKSLVSCIQKCHWGKESIVENNFFYRTKGRK